MGNFFGVGHLEIVPEEGGTFVTSTTRDADGSPCTKRQAGIANEGCANRGEIPWCTVITEYAKFRQGTVLEIGNPTEL